MITEEYYTETRAKLVDEYWFLRSRHCKLSAMARVRKIADLDFEFSGIQREETLKKFHYNELK